MPILKITVAGEPPTILEWICETEYLIFIHTIVIEPAYNFSAYHPGLHHQKAGMSSPPFSRVTAVTIETIKTSGA